MQRKGVRPSRHIRHIRVGRGRRFKRAVVINPHINRIIFRSSRKKDIDLFKDIAQKARAKGYNIPPIDAKRGPVVVENAPTSYKTNVRASKIPNVQYTVVDLSKSCQDGM